MYSYLQIEQDTRHLSFQKFEMAYSLYLICVLNFAKNSFLTCIADHNLIIKMGIPEFVLELQALKSKIKGVFKVVPLLWFPIMPNLPCKTPVILLESRLVIFHRAVHKNCY